MQRNIELLKRIGGFALLFIALVFLFQHQILYFLEREFLAPEEDTASVLYAHKRHLFGQDTILRLEARHVDWKSEIDWCAKARDGSWNSYFSWQDEE